MQPSRRSGTPPQLRFAKRRIVLSCSLARACRPQCRVQSVTSFTGSSFAGHLCPRGVYSAAPGCSGTLSHASPVRDAVTSPAVRAHLVTPRLFATRSQAPAAAGKTRYGPCRPSRDFSLRSRSCAAAHDGTAHLVFKMPHSGEHHRHTRCIGRSDHLRVAH